MYNPYEQLETFENREIMGLTMASQISAAISLKRIADFFIMANGLSGGEYSFREALQSVAESQQG
jgi:hypothetical protein